MRHPFITQLFFRVRIESTITLIANGLNAIAVTAKVRRIERQQPALSMREHGCNDVGVANLVSSYRNFAA